MNQSEIEAFVAAFDNVQRTENFGYTFFFVGDDNIVSFVTIADSANLNRDGVFRINIGVSRTTFQTLLGESSSEPVDYSLLNTFLPHPHYAKQHYICILNPSGPNIEKTKTLISEAYAIAAARFARKQKNIA
jgi:hypothetical protein